uniref:Uncharacterized protein n=1 Tax=Rhizophora mucronata TaxID=61149 RepID=A0A2P2NIZ9_RHIMU
MVAWIASLACVPLLAIVLCVLVSVEICISRSLLYLLELTAYRDSFNPKTCFCIYTGTRDNTCIGYRFKCRPLVFFASQEIGV